LERAAVVEIGDLDDARHRQGPMRSGQFVQIKNLAVGRISLVKLLAVPGGDPSLVIIVIDRRVVPDPVYLIWGTDLIHRPSSTVLSVASMLLGTACRQQDKDQYH